MATDQPVQPGQPWALAGSAPVPDPTRLTTDAVKALEDQLKELFGERFRSIDQQLELVERRRVEQKADTKTAVDSALQAEKEAVDAALQAQKEAVREQTTASDRAIAKSEAGMSEQLRQLGVNFTTTITGITQAMDDVRERITRLEAAALGRAEQRTEQRSISGGVIAAIGVGVAVAGLLVGLLLRL